VVRNNSGGFPLKYVSYREKNVRSPSTAALTAWSSSPNTCVTNCCNNGFDAKRIEIHAPVPRMGDPALRSSFSDRNLILYAGQIIRGKGVDVLLESLAKVKSNFECIILGDGNHKAYCEELSRKLGLAIAFISKASSPRKN
jgi:glycosyltransferase involved in cell wall biosynthesis